eukprot:TRINITY_DN8061_c0_g3_i1.p1 TRINITY_DN8061_c0_g3~~TRINITY_DN8061_c0_g3_i1.p1  ORF type:complete len:346 (+),score=93.68 TRINITY_DN8061_c0_g3_i1:115-1152(+)
MYGSSFYQPGGGMGMGMGGMGGYGAGGMSSYGAGGMGLQNQQQQQQQPRGPGQPKITGPELAIQALGVGLNSLTQLMQVAMQGASVGVGAWMTFAQMKAALPEVFGSGSPAGAPASGSRESGQLSAASQPPAAPQNSLGRQCLRQLATWAMCAMLYMLMTRLWRRLSSALGGSAERQAIEEEAPLPPLDSSDREKLRAIFSRIDEASGGNPTRGFVVESLLNDEESALLLEGSREESVLDGIAEAINRRLSDADAAVNWDDFGRELFGLPSGVDHQIALDWQAMYPYEAQREDEVSFGLQDKITVIDQQGPSEGWWLIGVASAGGGEQKGLAPANYLTLPGRNKI